jgi:L-fuconate dehydratase
MAFGAVVNAIWDLWARREGKPVWKLLADLTPQQTVDCVPFLWITDALTPDEALAILERNAPTRAAREAEMRRDGFPAYTTSAGWLGYHDEKVRRLCREAMAQGFTHFKMKVSRDLEGTSVAPRSCAGRSASGGSAWTPTSAGTSAGDRAGESLALRPVVDQRPTSPDDVLGHAAIASHRPDQGGHRGVCQNRVIFKQLLQAGALGYCQIDSCRVGGVNEVLAILLLAAKFEVPVCPHAGGVGLCEYVQHLAIYDYIAVNPSIEDRYCEYVDHLHEHFVQPVHVVNARYQAPLDPGYSIEMKEASLAEHEFPGGRVWRGVRP